MSVRILENNSYVFAKPELRSLACGAAANSLEFEPQSAGWLRGGQKKGLGLWPLGKRFTGALLVAESAVAHSSTRSA